MPDKTSTEDAFFATGDDRPSGATFEQEVERVARRPQAQWRSPLLSLAVVGFALFLAWSYRSELAYFFSDPTPVDIGHAYEGVDVPSNTYVHVKGLPSLLKVGYSQFDRRFKVYYLLGTHVFVRERIPDEDEAKKGAEADGTYPTFDGTGRLLDLSKTTDFVNVQRFYAERADWDFGKPAWIVLAGVAPRSQWQYPILVGVLLLIALGNLVLLGRRFLTRR